MTRSYKKRYRPGEKIYEYTGRQVKNSKGEIVQKPLFGFGKEQLRVSYIGSAKDRVKITDVSSGKFNVIPRGDYESLKEELHAGHFKSGDVFFRASYIHSEEFHNAQRKTGQDNIKWMIYKRYGDSPEFTRKRNYLFQLIDNLSYDQLTKFFEDNSKLISEMMDYDYYIDVESYTDTPGATELDALTEALEKQYASERRQQLKVITKLENYLDTYAQMIKYA